MTPLVLYHGAQRWDGAPEIRAARKGNVEHGPGIYFTTSYETAKKYAKGGGTVLRFELDPNLRWLHDVSIDVADMMAFVRSLPRLRKRKEILDDLGRSATRMDREVIPLSVLVNLMVNHDLVRGAPGPLLAAFLVQRGADAEHVTQGNEDWVVLYNTSKILSFKRVGPDLPVAEYDLPRVPKPRRENPARPKNDPLQELARIDAEREANKAARSALDEQYGIVRRPGVRPTRPDDLPQEYFDRSHDLQREWDRLFEAQWEARKAAGLDPRTGEPPQRPKREPPLSLPEEGHYPDLLLPTDELRGGCKTAGVTWHGGRSGPILHTSCFDGMFHHFRYVVDGTTVAGLTLHAKKPRGGKQTATIDRVFTDAAFRRHGYAKALLDAARAYFAKVGHSRDLTGLGKAWKRAVNPVARAYPLAPIGEWYGDSDYQKRGGKLAYMSPEEYLRRVRPLHIDAASRDNIDDLKAHIERGGTLDPLVIYADGREDGRHRAAAAKELGIKSVPVLVFREGNPAWTDAAIEKAWPALQQGALPAPLVKEKKGKHLHFEEYGCGHYGCVFPTSDPAIVYKVTSDASEAAFVQLLLDDKLQQDGLVRYHGIQRLEGNYKRRPLFAIWREAAHDVGFLTKQDGSYMHGGGDRDLQRFSLRLYSFTLAARAVRLLLSKSANPKSLLQKTAAREAWARDLVTIDDRDNVRIVIGREPYSDRDRLGVPDAGLGKYYKDIPSRLALLIRAAELTAEMMANEAGGYLVGEALERLLDKGILLADVHAGNIGKVDRPDHKDAVVITDPGHALAVKPELWDRLAPPPAASTRAANPLSLPISPEILSASIAKAERLLGIEVEKDRMLGCGFAGCAFRLTNGNVFKITNSDREANFFALASAFGVTDGIARVEAGPVDLENGYLAYVKEPLRMGSVLEDIDFDGMVAALNVHDTAEEWFELDYPRLLARMAEHPPLRALARSLKSLAAEGIYAGDLSNENLGMRHDGSIVLADAELQSPWPTAKLFALAKARGGRRENPISRVVIHRGKLVGQVRLSNLFVEALPEIFETELEYDVFNEDGTPSTGSYQGPGTLSEGRLLLGDPYTKATLLEYRVAGEPTPESLERRRWVERGYWATRMLSDAQLRKLSDAQRTWFRSGFQQRREHEPEAATRARTTAQRAEWIRERASVS